MTCDQVRELLPEHVLGTIEGPQDLEVRRHLRGCGGCRSEMAALGEGIAMFARAAHDRTPPPELRERVVTVLEEEWRDAEAASPRRRSRWMPAAAAVLLLVASLGWGVMQRRQADTFVADATSYRNLLAILGGEDFRIGTVHSQVAQQITGNLVLYDAHSDQSWALLIVHAPGMTGVAHATLSSADGRMIPMRDLRFGREGDASTWLVSYAGLKSFGTVTITSADGTVLATAQIRSA